MKFFKKQNRNKFFFHFLHVADAEKANAVRQYTLLFLTLYNISGYTKVFFMVAKEKKFYGKNNDFCSFSLLPERFVIPVLRESHCFYVYCWKFCQQCFQFFGEGIVWRDGK